MLNPNIKRTYKVNWLNQFLRGVDDEPSSKRLMGVFSGFVLVTLCLIGGVIILWDGKFDNFDNILWVLCPYSTALLGVGVLERNVKNTRRTSRHTNSTKIKEEVIN